MILAIKDNLGDAMPHVEPPPSQDCYSAGLAPSAWNQYPVTLDLVTARAPQGAATPALVELRYPMSCSCLVGLNMVFLAVKLTKEMKAAA
eukprot:15358692-Ditylum_brightwellii.AAC.1